MKTKLMFLIAVAAVAAPAAFGAPGAQTPAGACKAELKAVGEANFKSMYAPGGSGASAMGKCVSKHQRSAAANRASAQTACRAERDTAEATFRAAHGGKSFGELYGLNENDRNAFGKCVSSKASAADAREEAATMRAARACKAERGTTDASRAAFTAKYGGKAASAFGKCVSSTSKPA